MVRWRDSKEEIKPIQGRKKPHWKLKSKKTKIKALGQ